MSAQKDLDLMATLATALGMQVTFNTRPQSGRTVREITISAFDDLATDDVNDVRTV